MTPNPKDFFSNGKLHTEAAQAVGNTPAAFSAAISNGTYPFKSCRIKVGKHFVYDWDKCVQALINKNKPKAV